MDKIVTIERARQGQSSMGVQYALGIILFLAVAAMAKIGFVAF